MALTPLYTAAEIAAEITQAKADLSTARKALLMEQSGSNGSRRVQHEQVKSLQDHLDWLQRQRAILEVGPGAQSHVGRPAR